MQPTPTHLNYYLICKRKLWLFHHKIQCEWKSELVKIGKIYHEDFKDQEIEIDNFKIDKLSNGKVFEIKKKNTAPEAARFQVIYYLYLLKQKGIMTGGVIKYKESNRLEEVKLTPELEKELLQLLKDTDIICSLKNLPEVKRIRYCDNCSYYELCFS